MKKNSLFSLIPFVIIADLAAASGQGITGNNQSSQSPVRPDTGFINAERAYLAVKSGNLAEARKFLSIADPSNPFAMYVRAALTQDASEAAGIYNSIVSAYPGKPITRDALLQLYKYHYAAGEYYLAHTDYVELRKYPGMNQLVDPIGLKDTVQNTVSPTNSEYVQTPSSPDKAVVPSAQRYSVQVGVFSTRENAKRLVARLRTENIESSISPRVLADRTVYVVTAGDFRSREAADAFAADLKSRAFDCMVVEAGELQK